MNNSIHQFMSDKHSQKKVKQAPPSQSDQSPSPNDSSVPETVTEAVTKNHPKATPKKETKHE